jgi:hypothetical protein
LGYILAIFSQFHLVALLAAAAAKNRINVVFSISPGLPDGTFSDQKSQFG